MNDEQLNREIEEALAVEPSPQFAARVRTRVAASPRPSLWIRWRVIAAAGLAAAAVVALVAFQQPEPETSRPEKRAAKVNVNAEVKEEAAPLTALPQEVVVRHAAPEPPSRRQEPEVLFDPREVAAFRKFVEGPQEDRRIDLTKLIELQQAAAQKAPIEEIALMPIADLDPIVVESLNFGFRRIEGGSL